MKHIYIIKHNKSTSRKWLMYCALLKIVDGSIEICTLGTIRSNFLLYAVKKRMKKML